MIKPDILLTLQGKYPFYMSKTLQNQKEITLVEQNIHYQNDAEYNIFKEKILLRKTLFHPYLICMQDFREQVGCFKIFYEYVHLQMNGVCGKVLGSDFFKQIQQQMLSLVDLLRSKHLKFRFDPQNIGISEQLNLKYFLQDFNIEQADDAQFFQSVIQSINKYFKNFEQKSPTKRQNGRKTIHIPKTDQGYTTKQLSRIAHQSRKKSEQLLQKLKRS